MYEFFQPLDIRIHTNMANTTTIMAIGISMPTIHQLSCPGQLYSSRSLPQLL